MKAEARFIYSSRNVGLMRLICEEISDPSQIAEKKCLCIEVVMKLVDFLDCVCIYAIVAMYI